MNAVGYIKPREENPFYIKPVRGGYWVVINRYTMAMESLETSEAAAQKMADELNEIVNQRIKKTINQ